MSLVQKHACLKPLSKCKKPARQVKRGSPKIDFYKPTGAEDQTSDFDPQEDSKTDNQNAFIEDPWKTNIAFRGFLQLETCLLSLSVTSFVAEIFSSEFKDIGMAVEEQFLLISQSVLTLSILVILVFKYKLQLKLKKEQKVESLNATILHLQYSSWMLLEMVLCLPHPNLLSKDTTILVFQPYDQVYIDLFFNDILALAMLARTYLIIRASVLSTNFSSTRAARLCRIYGCEHSFNFSVKCIMKEIPIRALVFLIMMMVAIYGQGLRISEHILISHFPSSFDLSRYDNCFWTIITTMGTVGYGDYFPKTYMGRGIIFIASISGVIMTSLLIIVLSRYLSMSTAERKSYITLERLKLRGILQKAAREVIKQTAIMGYHLHTQDPQVQRTFSKLKQQTHQVKATMRKLQTVVDNDNVSEEMNRLFQILEMSLKEIYHQQLTVKKLLQGLYQQEKGNLRGDQVQLLNADRGLHQRVVRKNLLAKSGCCCGGDRG